MLYPLRVAAQLVNLWLSQAEKSLALSLNDASCFVDQRVRVSEEAACES